MDDGSTDAWMDDSLYDDGSGAIIHGPFDVSNHTLVASFNVYPHGFLYKWTVNFTIIMGCSVDTGEDCVIVYAPKGVELARYCDIDALQGDTIQSSGNSNFFACADTSQTVNCSSLTRFVSPLPKHTKK